MIFQGNRICINNEWHTLPKRHGSLHVSNNVIYIDGKLWSPKQKNTGVILKHNFKVDAEESTNFTVNGGEVIVVEGDTFSAHVEIETTETADKVHALVTKDGINLSSIEFDKCVTTLVITQNMRTLKLAGTNVKLTNVKN